MAKEVCFHCGGETADVHKLTSDDFKKKNASFCSRECWNDWVEENESWLEPYIWNIGRDRSA